VKPLTFQEIRSAVIGKALAPIPTNLPEIRAVCTDGRRMEPGSLFIGLRGAKYDGHDFLPQAAAGGAIAALVERPVEVELPNLHLLQVGDTRKAMGQLARYVRQQYRCKVIAVAGSNGKTSTKHLIHAALGGKLRGSMSPRSFNNDIGVPLTIFPADPMQDYLVLEMGTNHPGEILALTTMAEPDIAVITNASAEHLEGLEDLPGVRRENASVIEGLRPNGLLVVNGDDPDLVESVSHYSGQILTFGLGDHNDLFAAHIECDDSGVRFRLNNRPRKIFIPLLGKHTAVNALAAIAVGRRLRLDEQSIIDSLQLARGPDMRLQLQEMHGVRVLNDAYNANPASMRAALETVSELRTDGRRLAVVGDMRELGRWAERYHREIGQFAATKPLDALLCVGPAAKLIAEEARSAGMKAERVMHFADSSRAAYFVPPYLKSGDLILLKASRGVHLEEVAKAIEEARGTLQRMAAS
jgi:UDP-N-acetylmuramoyl-tripeptide--D-alanyl-D-alanine ligase